MIPAVRLIMGSLVSIVQKNVMYLYVVVEPNSRSMQERKLFFLTVTLV